MSNNESRRAFEYSVSGAARYLGVSVGTIRRYADSGALEHVITPGDHRRFSREQLDQFIERSNNER